MSAEISENDAYRIADVFRAHLAVLAALRDKQDNPAHKHIFQECLERDTEPLERFEKATGLHDEEV